MNKADDRKKRLARTFGVPDREKLLEQAQKNQSDRKSSALPTSALRSNMTVLETRVEELQQQLHVSATKQLDPKKILPSVVADRFPWDETDPDFIALKQSIQQDGQKLPILVRPHPEQPDYYQIAYGARRTRACEILEKSVTAFVQDLTDEELVVAQGIENNERTNLSFIEKALYALTLTKAGYSRSLVGRAIGVSDDGNVRKMTQVCEAVPDSICMQIGPCPSIGLPRWTLLAKAFEQNSFAAFQAIESAVETRAWAKADSNGRFEISLKIAQKLNSTTGKNASIQETFVSETGTKLATYKEKSASFDFSIDRKTGSEFAAYLKNRMPELIAQYEAENGSQS